VNIRRAAVTLLIAALLGIGPGSGVMAQSASPEPTAPGTRVELPEAGIAITFPSSWRVEATPKDPALVQAGYLLAWEYCRLYWSRPRFASPGEAADWFMGSGEPGDPILIDRTEVELPVGPAVRLDTLVGEEPDQGPISAYWVEVAGGLAWLSCHALTLPDDRWLHVAETIEALPEGPRQSAVDSTSERDFDGRVAVPQLGFAVTFPAEWNLHGIGTRDDRPPASGARPYRDANVLWAMTTDANCIVRDLSLSAHDQGWATVEDMHELYIARGQPHPDGFDRSEYLDLPAGRSGRADYSWTDEFLTTTYSFTDGHSWLQVDCGLLQRPNDSWLSIAETFEFLPEPG